MDRQYVSNAHHHLCLGLRLAAIGQLPEAAAEFTQAGDCGSMLGSALAKVLARQEDRNPYEEAHAFQVFINGGGNIALYEAVHRTLAELHRATGTRSLLDIGAGDGRALLPPLAAAKNQIRRLGIVEPSPDLLESLKVQLGQIDLPDSTEIDFWPTTLQSFVRTPHIGPGWDLAQATFSLQSLPPVERIKALKDLRPRIRRLAIIEFDVPDLDPGSEDELSSIAARFESGLVGYGENARLVAEGFLAPMLLGKVRSPGERHNWEQPAHSWRQELERADYLVDEVRTIALYSWSPAFLIIARPRS